MIKVIAPKMPLRRDRPRDPERMAAAASARISASPYAWSSSRVMRIVGSPDEVHRRAIARVELRK